MLGLRPISCHAALVYYNYALLDDDGPVDLTSVTIVSIVCYARAF